MISFDPKCYDLAKAFLADEPGLDTEAALITLAGGIQEYIEDEVAFMRGQMTKERANAQS